MLVHDKLPCDETAERAVLGSMLEDPDNIPAVLEILREEDFCNEDHRLLFRVIVQLWTQHGNKWDFVILQNYIKQKNLTDRLPIEWIEELYEEAVSPETLEEACKIVKEHSAKRAIIELGAELIQKAKENKDFHTLIEEAQSKIFSIAESATSTQYYHVKDVAQEVIRLIHTFKDSDRIITGLPSGFIELDMKTTGFHPGDLIILAARPGMGKSSFMLSVALNIAKEEQKPVAIFSLEMSKEQLVMRLLSMLAEVPLFKIRSGTITEEELKRLEGSALELSRYEIYLDDTPALSTTDLRIRARKLRKEKNVEFIAVDYLQLLRPPARKSSRQEEVAEVSRNLKALAKELHIPVMALAQLSREVEKRSDKRPQLADLRESGQIEQDADLILFLHRPDYYKKRPSPEEEGIAEVIIAKQRQGPTDVVKLAFIKEYTKFENLELAPSQTEKEDTLSEILESQDEEQELDIDF
ncbi:MAG: replicative DNA helicase [Aquificae bacterium]|nr:replicative DNA helicase [Aquificota bacterium]